MRYWLDTEFDGFGGDLISMALVREDGASAHWIIAAAALDITDSWVAANVAPVLHACPGPTGMLKEGALASQIAQALSGDADPVIIADWPDDIRYFCGALITGPGTMIDVPGIKFEVHRIDAYPGDGTELPGAVQHNAWWDAMALRYAMTGHKP